MTNIKSLSTKLIHYLAFKIEDSYSNPESLIGNIDEYENIVNIYKFIISNSIETLTHKESFTSSFSSYLSYMTDTNNHDKLSSSDIDYLYEIIIGNIDKIVILKESNSNSSSLVKGFNLNIQKGITHQNYNNFNSPSLLLELFRNDSKEGDLFEMNVESAEQMLSKLKEIYKNL